MRTPFRSVPAATRLSLAASGSGDWAAAGGVERGHARERAVLAVGFADAPMAFPARGHLRGMGDDENLDLAPQARQAVADRRRGGAAHAGIDLVENQRARAPDLGQRDPEREHEPRQLAAGGDAPDGAERRAGIGRDLELHAFGAIGPPIAIGSGVEAGAKLGTVELEGRELGRDGLVEAGGCVPAQFGQA